MTIVIGSYVKSLVRINSYVPEGSYGKVYEVYDDDFFVRWEGGDSTYARGADLELVSQEDAEKLFGHDPEALKKPFIYIEVMRDDESRGLNVGEVYIPTYKHIHYNGETEISFYSKNSSSCCWETNRANSKFKVVGSDVERTDLYPKVLLDWGFEYAMAKKYGDHSGQVLDFFYSFFNDEIKKFQMGWMRIDVFRPEPSKTVRGAISIFQNKTKKDRDVKTPYSKIGRAFRAMFPEATDAQIEKWADKYREVYPINDYVLKSGTERADFKKAYAGDQVPCQNPYTTSSRKSLANSCMRYSFDDLDMHPTETYASGDFKIYWTELADGRVGSRCVVYTPKDDKPQAGPIYGVCEHSINVIEEELKSIGAEMFNNGSSWFGAKLLHVKLKRDAIVGPYIDDEYQNLVVSDCGEYVTITNSGHNAYEASNYSGRLTMGDYEICADCGEQVDSDEVYYGPDNQCLCEHCYSSNFCHCDYYNETREVEGGQDVMYRSSSRFWSGWACEEAIEKAFTFCENEGIYYPNDYVYEAADGTYVSQRSIDNDDYVLCEVDNLARPIDEMGRDTDGQWKNLQWLNENGYQRNADGEYEQKEAA